MRQADFDAAAATIRQETAGEWEARPLSVVAGRVAVVTLYYRGHKITSSKCLDRDGQWLFDFASAIYSACLRYAVADMQVAA